MFLINIKFAMKEIRWYSSKNWEILVEKVLIKDVTGLIEKLN